MTSHRNFTDEQKADAVARFLKLKADGQKIRDIERIMGMNNTTLYKWVEDIKQKSKQLPPLKLSSNGAESSTTEAEAQPVPPAQKNELGHFDSAVRQQGRQMLASGMRIVDVAAKLGVPVATVAYWRKAANIAPRLRVPATADAGVAPIKSANGIGSAGAITDALIYLRHAEKEIMDMVRDGKITRPDQAHLLTLLALGALQKSTFAK